MDHGNPFEEVLGMVVVLDTSSNEWNALLYQFAQESQKREFCLLQQLQLLRKGNLAICEYVRAFKAICDDLSTIGKPLDDRRKVFDLLKGLGLGYESFCTSMLKPPIPSYTELVPLFYGQ